MSVPTKYLFAATGLLLVALINDARAQMNLPFGPANYDHNFQLFAPLDLDLNNLPDQDTYGYFFNYDKLWWSYTGERVTIGDPNVVEFVETIYYPNLPDDLDQPPPPYQIFNSLNNVPPNAGFAFGDRYEFGYEDGAYGWTIGILDGPKLYQSEFYGFTPRADGGLPPFIDPDYTDGDDIGPGGGPVGESRAFGFGSVAVLFNVPFGYLMGFRDYLNNLAGAQQGTVGGIYLRVDNYGNPVFVEGNEVDDDVLFRRADDLNENGVWGFGIIVDEEGNIIGEFTDFGDLHQFNIFFDNVTVRNTTDTDGVEVMWTQALTNRRYMAKNQNNRLELSYGARFMRVDDNFRVDASGSILGTTFWDTTVDNQIVGPQVALKWINQRQRWTTTVNARFMFGYNTQDWSQNGIVGEGLVPGALNSLLYGRPTAFNHGEQEREFSPVAELRIETAYKLTQSFALTAGYTGMFVGNIRRAATSVEYTLPYMGYKNAGTQNFLSNGFNFGVEFVH